MEPCDCYPISVLPHLSRLFLDYCASAEPLRPFFPNTPNGSSWRAAANGNVAPNDRLADLLERQNRSLQAGPAAFANVDRLRAGARAVITGQQVGLFGGPAYTLHKAATAIRRAQEASAAGTPTVPIFWLATEDHDFAEIDHVAPALAAGDRDDSHRA